MLRPINEIIRNTVGNIIHRLSVVTGEVAVDNGNGSYDVFIAGDPKAYPRVFTLARDPDIAVGDTVRILYKKGNKDTPIIWPPEKPTAIIGDLIICCFETHKIWRCSGLTSMIIDTITNINSPSGLTVANGNLISVGYVPSLGWNLYICVHNGFSEEIISYFAPPGSWPNGLAWNGTNLISCDLSTRKIYIHNGLSATILSSFNSPAPYPGLPRGLTVISGNLISADANSDMIYIHNGITETVKSSFVSPENPFSTYGEPAPNGLTNDGTNLILGDNGFYGVEDDVIFVFDGITSTIKSYFQPPAGCKRVNGLAYFK